MELSHCRKIRYMRAVEMVAEAVELVETVGMVVELSKSAGCQEKIHYSAECTRAGYFQVFCECTLTRHKPDDFYASTGIKGCNKAATLRIVQKSECNILDHVFATKKIKLQVQ